VRAACGHTRAAPPARAAPAGRACARALVTQRERGRAALTHTSRHHSCPQASFADAANWRGAAQPGGKRGPETYKAAWRSPARDKEGTTTRRAMRASRPSHARACAPAPQILSASANLHSRAEVTTIPTATCCGRVGRICAAAHPLAHRPKRLSACDAPRHVFGKQAQGAAAATAHQNTQSNDVLRAQRGKRTANASPATT
jgi:hypothetical protein